ncbi:MAG: aminoacyl-tRNA hydrolase [Clostridia bacterium]|nr:aminoacyl-tRNA hydrolase [Clostridia bacterium]
MSSIFDLFKRIEKSPPPGPPSVIVACLGNPGKEYALTRHNSGFLFAEYYALNHGFKIDRARFDGVCGETMINETRALFLCPMTYMNESGKAVRKAADFYKIPPEKIFVFCDDVNLDVGKMRIRRKGSDGGQKGLRSIITELGTEAFPRIRIGVGKKPDPDGDLCSWVLGKFTEDDQKKLKTVFDRCSDALSLVVSGDFETAMCRYN